MITFWTHGLEAIAESNPAKNGIKLGSSEWLDFLPYLRLASCQRR